jgi:aryl-alcohol dehydrogenase-like predicted oxidoreductase
MHPERPRAKENDMSLATRPLGQTGLEVTRLGYGAMELAGIKGPIEPVAAHRLLNRVLDAGVRLIDTSPDYGASEERIGEAIAHRRDEYVLASKCGCPVTMAMELRDGRPVHDFSEENVRAGVEQSLQRMRTDRLDLVQVHMSPSRAEMEAADTIGTLETLKQEGKLRFIGMSGVLPDLRDHLDMAVFSAFQIPYSALEREHESIISEAAAAGAGTIIRGGVARGAPAPDQNPEEALGFWRSAMIQKRDLWEEARLDEIKGADSRMDFLLRFTLSHPDIDSVIVGTANPEHFDANVRAASAGPLPAETYAEAKRRLDAVVGAGAA